MPRPALLRLEQGGQFGRDGPGHLNCNFEISEAKPGQEGHVPPRVFLQKKQRVSSLCATYAQLETVRRTELRPRVPNRGRHAGVARII